MATAIQNSALEHQAGQAEVQTEAQGEAPATHGDSLVEITDRRADDMDEDEVPQDPAQCPGPAVAAPVGHQVTSLKSRDVSCLHLQEWRHPMLWRPLHTISQVIVRMLHKLSQGQRAETSGPPVSSGDAFSDDMEQVLPCPFTRDSPQEEERPGVVTRSGSKSKA